MNVKVIIDNVVKLGGSHLDFIKNVFSDKGAPSMSRVMTLPVAATACFSVLWITVHDHKVLSYYEALGYSTFAATFYAVNRATTAWAKNPQQPEAPKEKPNG